MALRAGSWKIGGYSLPEFGITEKIQSIVAPQKSYTSAGGSNLLGSSRAATPPPPITDTSIKTPVYPSVLGMNTATKTYSAPSNNQPEQSTYQQSQDIVNQNTNDSLDSINRDYEDNMRMLGDYEQTAQGQAAEASGTLSSEATNVGNQIANQQAVDVQGQEQQLATGEKTAAEGLRGARDLFRQIQQNNIMQLSGAGLSSSSVAEAMAETLGVETARRIAGITGNIGEIRQNVTKEIGRIRNFYEGKKTEMTQWVANQKLAIQNQLNQTLRDIATKKQMAASAKANARAEALSQQRSDLFQLEQQENQFQNSLKLWAQQKADATSKIITDPNVIAAVEASMAGINSPFNPTQYSLNRGVTNEGQPYIEAGSLKQTTTKKNEEDELTNPFSG